MICTESIPFRTIPRTLMLLTIVLCLAASTVLAEEQPLSLKDHANQLMHEAIANHKPNIVLTALKQGADPDSEPRSGLFPRNALARAVWFHSPEIIQILLDHGANIDNLSSFGSTNPLCTAIEIEDTEIIQLLLQRGANLNKNIGFLNNWRRPLHFAARTGKLELVQLLLNEGAIVIPNKTEAAKPRFLKMFDDYASLLNSAERGGNKEIYKLLEKMDAL